MAQRATRGDGGGSRRTLAGWSEAACLLIGRGCYFSVATACWQRMLASWWDRVTVGGGGRRRMRGARGRRGASAGGKRTAAPAAAAAVLGGCTGGRCWRAGAVEIGGCVHLGYAARVRLMLCCSSALCFAVCSATTGTLPLERGAVRAAWRDTAGASRRRGAAPPTTELSRRAASSETASPVF